MTRGLEINAWQGRKKGSGRAEVKKRVAKEVKNTIQF
jgi:hypothetical protein